MIDSNTLEDGGSQMQLFTRAERVQLEEYSELLGEFAHEAFNELLEWFTNEEEAQAFKNHADLTRNSGIVLLPFTPSNARNNISMTGFPDISGMSDIIKRPMSRYTTYQQGLVAGLVCS